MPAGGQPMDDTQFRAWKSQLVPLLYDWFSNHNLTWPSQACRWGPKLDEHTFKNKYRIYISEQTSPDEPTSDPPKLLLVDADICKPRVASTEVVATWGELSRCPYIKEVKTIVHPGEVNKIREIPSHPEVLVTHTDAPELYVWNTASQPNMTRDKETKRWGQSVADMKLVGHEKDALFPLATCNAAPLVASGGTDKLVVLWDLRDEMDGLLAAKRGDTGGERTTTELQCRQKLVGHKKTVEDLVFQPGSQNCLVSVGDDAQVLFWDSGKGSTPIAAIEKAHGSCDVHTVDWSGLQEWLIVTGAADGSLKVWDRRKLPASGAAPGSALHCFNYHTDAIMRVEWHPTEQGILASGGEDHLVVVWSLERATAAAADAGAAGAGSSKAGSSSRAGSSKEAPPEVLFKHVGHRAGKVVDFQWCPSSPWTMMSVSDDTNIDADGGGSKGGGTLQIWRISDMLYLPEEAVVAELEAHREWILTGREAPRPKPKAPAADAAAGGAAAAAAAVLKSEDKGAVQRGEGGGKKGDKGGKAAAAAVKDDEAMEGGAAADPMEVEEGGK